MNTVLIFTIETSENQIVLQLPLTISFVPTVGMGILPPMHSEQDVDIQIEKPRSSESIVRLPALFNILRIGYHVDQKLIKLYSSYFCESEENLRAVADAVRLEYGFTQLH